jgi:hypothetical protein
MSGCAMTGLVRTGEYRLGHGSSGYFSLSKISSG